MLKENVLKKFSPLIKKVWLSSPTMHGEELKYMQEAYETNWMSTVGENINAVEQMLCEKIGCKYAVALASVLRLCIWQSNWPGCKTVIRFFAPI